MRTSPPAAAVIIPCYNLGSTLEAAVESVLAQTYPAAEILVVDDGSRDPRTIEALDRLDRARVRIARLEHAGVAATRNAGVALTTAPYVVFLDADDLLAETYLEKTATRLDADPTLAFVSCAVRAFEGASYNWRPPALDLVGSLTRGSVHISTLFRRALWDTVGGFDPELPAYEDMDFWLRALALGFRGEILDEALLNYRVRAGSRYRRGIEPERYAEAMKHIVAKHGELMRTRGVEVLIEKERFLVDLLDYRDSLQAERTALRQELESLRARRSAVILAYHRVADLDPDTHGLCISPQTFAEHVRYLAHRCTPLPLEELWQAAREDRLPERAVALTLDDGYLDALTVAAPILVEHGVPATFFVNTERLNEDHEAWHDLVERVLLSERLPPHIELDAVTFDLSTPDAQRAALLELHGILLPLDRVRRDALVEQVAALGRRHGVDLAPRDSRRPLRSDEIVRLASLPGVTIGSHSAHHLWLPRQPIADQRDEVVAGKVRLEALVERSVSAFCYPFGAAGPEPARVVRDAGHSLAVTTEPGRVTAAADPFALPRLEASAWSVAELATRLDEREVDAPPTPRFLIIDPTSRCNARCVMCPVSFRSPTDHGMDLPEIDFEKLRPLIGAAKQTNLFATGEPTLAPSIGQFIAKARSARAEGAEVWLCTNGKRLAREFVETLAAPGMGLQFSVDGGTREVFERIRRGIRFEELLASLALANEVRSNGRFPRLSFSSTMSRQNIDDLSNIFALARRFGIDQVIFYDEDPESPERDAYVLDETDRPRFEVQRAFIDGTGIRYFDGLTFRGATGARRSPTGQDRAAGLRCSAPWNVFYLRADGDVRTCCTLRESMGTLRGHSFEEVWNGEAYVRLRRAFVEQRGIPDACYRCTDPLRTWSAVSTAATPPPPRMG